MQIVLTITPQPDGRCQVSLQIGEGLEPEAVEDVLHVAMGLARQHRREQGTRQVVLASTLPHEERL